MSLLSEIAISIKNKYYPLDKIEKTVISDDDVIGLWDSIAFGSLNKITFLKIKNQILSGNSSTSTKLATPRSITLSGDASGTVNFDGSANISIPVVVANNSHNHLSANITDLAESVQDIIAPMFNTTGSGITTSYDDALGLINFSTNPHMITLTGDVAGTATITGLNDISITTIVANDSHTHAFTNLTSKPTTLAGYGITDGINNNQRGVANGVATLDGSGIIISTQLPSYVDDILEFATLATFPATGESGKIYVDTSTNKTYRWSGTVYIYITSGAVDSVAGKTGIVTLVKSDVGLSNVDNIADSVKNVLSASKLTTTRSITLSGDVSGTVNFDGSANVNITSVVADDSHNHSNYSLTSHNHTFDALSNVNITEITAGEISKWNGTHWVNNTLAEAGIQPSGAYLIGNQTITLTGDVTGSGTTSIAITVVDNSHNHLSANITDASNINTPSVVVKRDVNGDFSASVITATLNGNASTTTKLATARSITLNGDVSGTVNFDGSANVSITTTIADDSHNHTFANLLLKPTTVAGYGITDVYTKTEIDNMNVSADLTMLSI